MKAEIKIFYKNENHAEAIAKALQPDNFSTPPKIKVKTINVKNIVVSKVECKKKIESFIETIDDLLRCLQVAENILKKL
ncbi:MAG: KEOPS complex subunit Pcc1 [Candidatus Bathyarchaeia archaeon]|nr:KEOPS complex subunit [Candidatus Bathyarchaeota archaeon]